jgi:uncharacterized protein (TIGR02285 family)
MLLRGLFLLLAFGVQAKPQLNWLQTDWPPHQIVSGPYQGQGTFDLLQQHINKLMPQFEHHNQLVSLPRLEQAFQSAQTTSCTVGALYSEDNAANRLYSVPMAVGPALAVGYLAGALIEHPASQADGIVLETLAVDPALTGVYQPNRLYPQAISAVLQQPGINLSDYSFTSEVNAAALLASGRVNYVIEYPQRMKYYNQLLPEPAALEHRAIVGANVASVTFVSCTNDETGRAAIHAVNQALQELWQQASYIEAMQYWLDDSARRRMSTEISRLREGALMQFQPRPDNAVNARNQ